jgi:plastocyanin
MHIPVRLAASLALVALAAACAGNPQSSAPASAAASGAASEPAGGAAVTIVDFAFQPTEVTAKVGDTVTWTSQGDAPHTVKWADGAAESEQLSKGDSYERTFDEAGSFPYVCGIHPNMTGTITVQ